MAQKKSIRSSPFKAAIIISLIKILAYLPLPISRFITKFFAWMSYQCKSASRRVTEINLRLCFPDMSDQDRQVLARNSMIASGQLVAETARVWIRPTRNLLSMIKEVNGASIIQQLNEESQSGSILITPHLGNWELLSVYLPSVTKISALYRAPNIAELGPIIVAGRERAGLNMIKSSKMEIRNMLLALKRGENIIMLPDQMPQFGSGVFAPFFGNQAYTMTLLQGLAQRTHAKLVMATCIRISNGFKINLSNVDIDLSLSNELFAEQLNMRMQEEIVKTPDQYEWAYKRFKATKAGELDIYQ